MGTVHEFRYTPRHRDLHLQLSMEVMSSTLEKSSKYILPNVGPLQIGDVLVDPPILQAPMAGFTNYAFRQIVRQYGGAGLIAVITGYYTQENSSLLYNRLLETIHERCDGLKINIQLKILHALIELPEVPIDTTSSSPGADAAAEVTTSPAADTNLPAIDAECNEPPPEKIQPRSPSDSSA